MGMFYEYSPEELEDLDIGWDEVHDSIRIGGTAIDLDWEGQTPLERIT